MNELSEYDIDKRKMKWIVYNHRKGENAYKLPEYLLKMAFLDEDGNVKEENSLFEARNMTIVGMI